VNDEVEETMARPDKAAAVAELKDKFTNSAGAVLTEYRGLTVAELKELRRNLGEDATYAVSKNTLTKIAAREAGVEGVEEHLVGPTAIAFVDGDPVAVAKGLRNFAKANPLLVIKGGVLDGRPMVCPCDAVVAGHQRTLEHLGKRHKGRVVGGEGVAQLPHPTEQRRRRIAHERQLGEVVEGIGRPVSGQPPPTHEPAKRLNDLTVQEMRDVHAVHFPEPSREVGCGARSDERRHQRRCLCPRGSRRGWSSSRRADRERPARGRLPAPCPG
jgi:large subunit ribosomal protein L10